MRPDGYQYAIEQCDVAPERYPTLRAFRDKRAQWLEWLENDEDHAIWTNISVLVWNDVSFRTLAQIALENPDSSLGNTLVAEKITYGHMATQVLAIRRLMDRTKGVISLRHLVNDVRRNIRLLSRENYVCFDGLPYDYEPARQREFEAHVGKGAFWVATKGPDAWGTSQMVHRHFDRLSGVAADSRRREDRLPVALIDSVEGWLDKSQADELANWSHAFLAHAGSVQRREGLRQAIVSNAKITEAIKVIARVAEAISAEILYVGGRLNGLMPTPQFDQLEKLEKPVMRVDQDVMAREVWRKLSAERDGFAEGIREELLVGVRGGSDV